MQLRRYVRSIHNKNRIEVKVKKQKIMNRRIEKKKRDKKKEKTRRKITMILEVQDKLYTHLLQNNFAKWEEKEGGGG